MNKEMLIEIMASALDNGLCGGCETSPSPYAYENGGSCDKCRLMAAIEIASIIRGDAQTVDVAPVVHGRWMSCRPLGDGTPEGYMCSVCHIGGWEKTNFCPMCGADMRKDGGDETD